MNNFKKIILSNGIPLYLYINPSMKRVFVSYNIKYGSSGEWFNFNNNGHSYNVIAGHAHFLEHLLGEHSKYGDMYKKFDNRFQRANAYTDMNVTSFHFNGRDEIEKSLEELIIGINTPVFDQKDVDVTRLAILEEVASYEDDTTYKLQGLLERNLYKGFELIDKSFLEIGNRETTRQITIDGLYDCYDAFYSDDKKYIIIGGNIDENRIVDLLNNIFSKLPSHKSNLVLPKLNFDGLRRKYEVIDGDLDIPKVGFGIKFKKNPSVSIHELFYVLYIIRDIILNSEELRILEADGVFDVINFFYITVVNDYINYTFGSISKYKKELIYSIFKLLSEIHITKEEYQLVRRGLIAAELRNIENKYSHLENFPIISPWREEYSNCEFYKSIDYDRFMEIASTLDFSNYTVGEIKRLKKNKSHK